MVNQQIKVLIVDDSLVERKLLTFIIESDPQLKVVGYAESGTQAVEMLKTYKPDIVTMDIVMPKMDGFETTKKIMSIHPVPIVIISSIFKKGDAQKSFKAIEAGALAILEKPRGIADPNFEEDKKKIIETLKVMAGVKVLTRRTLVATKVKQVPPTMKKTKKAWDRKLEAVGIAASLGGPQTIAAILSKIPKNFPAPIFVVQHISSGFINGFIEWLGGSTELKVKLGQAGDQPKPGFVYVAPDGHHMEISKDKHIMLVDDPPINGLRPSAGRLFHSMGDAYGANAIGVILTGMGKDGAQDLLYMKQKGAYTIAQDEESCTVFGMPGEAIRLDAVDEALPPQGIVELLNQFVRESAFL